MSNKKDVVKKSNRFSTSTTSNSSSRRLERETSKESKAKKEDEQVSDSVRSNVNNKQTTRTSSKVMMAKKATGKPDVKSDTPKITKPVIKTSTSKTTKTKHKTVENASTRVVKSQYFPSKSMYSNVVKEKLKIEDKNVKESPKSKIKSGEESGIRRKRISDQTETKASNVQAVVDSSAKLERPRTATLRKGSIVNMNIAGPDAPKIAKKNSKPKEYEYEDDFDSYESDFDEYNSSSSSTKSDIRSVESYCSSDDASSTDVDSTQTQSRANAADEERKLDSGNFELREYKHKQLLDNIKESVEQENAALSSNMTSLSDEGFEEGKSMQSAAFINFLDAQKKCIRRKSLAKKQKRGKELLSMIRLDHQNFTILDIPAIPYEAFIKIYGNRSALQASSQTGEDNIDEETQSDCIEIVNKWTQCPIVISKIDETKENFMTVYRMDYAGVGSDPIPDVNISDKDTECNFNNLSRFLASVEDVVTQLIRKDSNGETIKSKAAMQFSEGCIAFRMDSLAFLRNKPIKFITFCPRDESRFLTVHGDESSERNVICVWNIANATCPEKALTTFGDVTCCCFGLDNLRVIFGAFVEGTIAIWTLGEYADSRLLHKEENYSLITPSFITDVNFAHAAKVVSIQPFADDIDEILQHASFHWKPSSQVCSLDEDGTLIIWSVILKFRSLEEQNVSNSGSVSLVQNSRISLLETHPDLKGLQCVDMTINILDLNHLFISTNYGYILHQLASGAKPTPAKFGTNEMSPTNCLAACPFSPSYFLAGQENGKLILYSRSMEKSLKEMTNIDDSENCRIESVQWSYNKPFVFYSKDNRNTIHVWDLASSDMYPVYSVPFQERINYIRLSPTINKESARQRSYMIIVFDDCKIDLHVLNSDHGQQTLENYREDVKKFLNYVNRF